MKGRHLDFSKSRMRIDICCKELRQDSRRRPRGAQEIHVARLQTYYILVAYMLVKLWTSLTKICSHIPMNKTLTINEREPQAQ